MTLRTPELRLLADGFLAHAPDLQRLDLSAPLLTSLPDPVWAQLRDHAAWVIVKAPGGMSRSLPSTLEGDDLFLRIPGEVLRVHGQALGEEFKPWLQVESFYQLRDKRKTHWFPAELTTPAAQYHRHAFGTFLVLTEETLPDQIPAWPQPTNIHCTSTSVTPRSLGFTAEAAGKALSSVHVHSLRDESRWPLVFYAWPEYDAPISGSSMSEGTTASRVARSPDGWARVLIYSLPFAGPFWVPPDGFAPRGDQVLLPSVPGVPVNLTVKGKDSVITLAWQAPLEGPVTHYHIWRQVGAGAPVLLRDYLDSTVHSVNLVAAPAGHHTYRVQALNPEGAGARSEAAAITIE